MMEKDQKNTPGIEENMDGANEKGAIEVKGENGTANSIEMERLVKKEEIKHVQVGYDQFCRNQC
jgi:hypothetical protein